jgi:plasmid stabilization system protein ParE
MCPLSDRAMMGTPLSSIAKVDGDYRFPVSGNYLTFYRVRGGDVHIDRIHKAAADMNVTL